MRNKYTRQFQLNFTSSPQINPTTFHTYKSNQNNRLWRNHDPRGINNDFHCVCGNERKTNYYSKFIFYEEKKRLYNVYIRRKRLYILGQMWKANAYTCICLWFHSNVRKRELLRTFMQSFEQQVFSSTIRVYFFAFNSRAFQLNGTQSTKLIYRIS